MKLGVADGLLLTGALAFIVLAALVALGGSPVIVGVFAAVATVFAYLMGARTSARRRAQLVGKHRWLATHPADESNAPTAGSR